MGEGRPVLYARPYFAGQSYEGHWIRAVEVDVENGLWVGQVCIKEQFCIVSPLMSIYRKLCDNLNATMVSPYL